MSVLCTWTRGNCLVALFCCASFDDATIAVNDIQIGRKVWSGLALGGDGDKVTCTDYLLPASNSDPASLQRPVGQWIMSLFVQVDRRPLSVSVGSRYQYQYQYECLARSSSFRAAATAQRNSSPETTVIVHLSCSLVCARAASG